MAFPFVPVNPFWLHTFPHTCRGVTILQLVGVQSGNTRMKWFVCGVPHEEDQKPAAWLVCPQDSGDVSALPPALSSAL